MARTPGAAVTENDFRCIEEEVPVITQGEALVRVNMISIDPAFRADMQADVYRTKILPGDVMPAAGVAEVVASATPALKVGDVVTAPVGWQQLAIVVPEFARVREPAEAPEVLLSLLGSSGLTAFYGFFEIGRPRPSETVLISGAAGSVGVIVSQLARMEGCRVIAIAGGMRKRTG